MDKNTYYHFGLALIGALVITLISNESYASWIMAGMIFTCELVQGIPRWRSGFFKWKQAA